MIEGVIDSILFGIRIFLPFLGLVIVVLIFASMRNNRRSDRPLITLQNKLTKKLIPVLYWENSIGRSKSSDIAIKNDPTISRDHAVLFRRDEGWIIADTESNAGVIVNGKLIVEPRQVYIGDTISLGGTSLLVKKTDLNEETKQSLFFDQVRAAKAVKPWALLFVINFFHILMALEPIISKRTYKPMEFMPVIFLFTISLSFLIITRFILGRRNFELEALAIFLSGIGILLIGQYDIQQFYIQTVSMCLGMLLFCFIIWFIGDLKRVAKSRRFIGLIAILIFIINLVIAKDINGAKNWIHIGALSIQPSEFVKIAFIFVGASSLDRLQTTRNLSSFIGFAALCIGALFLMKDFGTACVFFVAFLVIAFMRSGSIRTVILACSAAAIGAFMILQFKPYIADRFAIWGNVWSDVSGDGFQQARALCYSASGGLFGVGCGLGWLHDVVAGTSDLMFGTVCEEMGLLVAIVIALSIAGLAMYSQSVSSRSRSTFYSISACAAAAILIFQASLHIFGSMDILPFTGVTLPFISMGGSSMVANWGLLAFIKASDEKTYALRR